MRTVTREQPNSRLGSFRPLIRAILTVGTLFTLAACGGGGGSDPPPTPPPPVNTAPTAQAGSDQTITLPTDSVQLQGSGNDAQTASASLTYSWAVTTGAGVTFNNNASATATATFPAAGTYVLTLTASDGSLTGADTVQITVNPEATANAAPVVEAGVDQTAELPVGDVELAGSATDDGLPASSTLTYAWSVTGGAAGVTFANAAAAATTATFPAAGTYELTLTVGDSALSGTDTVQVVVDPAVYPAASTDADPNQGWTVATPVEMGMDEADLIVARDYALTGGGSGMIIRRGRLVYQWGDIDLRYDLKSTTKSIGSIALGLAVDDGSVALTDVAQVHLPSIGDQPPENVATGWLDDITLLQLATHTAGFPKLGGYEELEFPPGSTWFYSDGGLNWLADLLTEVYAQDLNTLLANVWSVVGIVPGIHNANPALGDDLRWRPNVRRPGPHPSGIEHRELASGISANTNAMARIGLLFLRNGLWANDARVLSESFVDTVQTPQSAIAGAANPDAADFPQATANYGVLWWTNATGLLPEVPTDAYWAWGLGDSLIVVIPSLDLVIARTGNNPDVPALPKWREDWNGDYTVLAPFLNPIVQSVDP